MKLCVPSVEAVQPKVAMLGEPPLKPTPEASKVLPSKKLTVPLAVGDDTVAVNVTVCPNAAVDAGEAASAVVVAGAIVSV
jgi:hypothetical protein